uniref:Uncharacterized protein n=1 Tax=Arundo donax TaxID=35708 RepID=A0A0A9AVC2_ARUDO
MASRPPSRPQAAWICQRSAAGGASGSITNPRPSSPFSARPLAVEYIESAPRPWVARGSNL